MIFAWWILSVRKKFAKMSVFSNPVGQNIYSPRKNRQVKGTWFFLLFIKFSDVKAFCSELWDPKRSNQMFTIVWGGQSFKSSPYWAHNCSTNKKQMNSKSMIRNSNFSPLLKKWSFFRVGKEKKNLWNIFCIKQTNKIFSAIKLEK
jgi:hypothetical protein